MFLAGFFLYQKGRDSRIFQAQDRALHLRGELLGGQVRGELERQSFVTGQSTTISFMLSAHIRDGRRVTPHCRFIQLT